MTGFFVSSDMAVSPAEMLKMFKKNADQYTIDEVENIINGLGTKDQLRLLTYQLFSIVRLLSEIVEPPEYDA